MTKYVVYDVFTEQAFGGNQLAVFPDATSLPEDKLQKIAAEFNFSEVTFVYPPEDPDHTAKVRIFTPTSEIDFAGHPTIGTIIALADLGQSSPLVLELGVGPLECTRDAKGAAFTTAVPLERFSEPDPALVAAAIGLPASAIRTDTHVPIQAGMVSGIARGLSSGYRYFPRGRDTIPCRARLRRVRLYPGRRKNNVAYVCAPRQHSRRPRHGQRVGRLGSSANRAFGGSANPVIRSRR